MSMHQMAHHAVTHTAQLHFYGSLASGVIFLLMTVGAYHGLIKTRQRRSQRDLRAAIISVSGIGLVSSGVLLNAFVPLKPHHFASLFFPTSGLGAVLVVGGFLFALIGMCLMPKGEAGRWLPLKEQNESGEAQPGVWPPAPRP